MVWGWGRETREVRQPLKGEVLNQLLWLSLVAQLIKTLPAVQKMQEMGVRSLGQEDTLEEGMATHFSVLAWRTPTDRGGWRAIGIELQRAGHD